MATTERDYYELLGVPRTATDAEIKKAFRRLARELHPDVSERPETEERFREVAEAYEVLSNSETRQLYDRYGHAGLRGGNFRPTHFDFGNLGDLFSAFF
ncbi:MAG TPA: DnaJ domain-containing protein, partial [Gaiellaceae bacterium]